MWEVALTAKVGKQAAKLPKNVRTQLQVLIEEIQKYGPVRGNWPNYSKLGADLHHCHIKKGRPTYVAIWREQKGKIQLVSIVYAGTHEHAPY